MHKTRRELVPVFSLAECIIIDSVWRNQFKYTAKLQTLSSCQVHFYVMVFEYLLSFSSCLRQQPASK